MFELLGLSLLLAALLIFNSFASLVIAGVWRVAGRATDNWTAASRARLLFSLRVLPALLAFLTVALLLVPSYLAYEPRHNGETVSFKLGLLALLSATGIAVSIYRGVATNRATRNLTSDWLKQGKPIQIPGIDIQSYQIQHAFPLIGIVGFLRPRLFIASQVLELLTPEEIAAAIAHENGHLMARDNLKRGLLRACRDTLLIIPCGRLLDRSWSEASEEAADENAARQGNGVALDLASALDDIVDYIEEVADYLGLYRIEAPMDQAQELSRILHQACREVNNAIPRLRTFGDIRHFTVEINRLENEADDAYRHGLATLFKGGYDAIEVMKLRDIIDNLESATDRCEDVANILEGIVLEYS